MPRTRRKKPQSPAEIAEALARVRAAKREAMKNPENWGADGKALKAQQDVDVVTDKRGRVQTARRDDVFDRLLARGGLSQAAHQAVRRLEADMAERRGEGEKAASAGKVDASGAAELVTQRMIDAGKRVDAALALVGLRDSALLRELLQPSIIHTADEERWRYVVRVLTKETRQEVQAGAVRSASENLALAYRHIDTAPRKAA